MKEKKNKQMLLDKNNYIHMKYTKNCVQANNNKIKIKRS